MDNGKHWQQTKLNLPEEYVTQIDELSKIFHRAEQIDKLEKSENAWVTAVKLICIFRLYDRQNSLSLHLCV